MKTHTQVLIVGAGPTGLMMACLLHRYKIPFRIIDKKDLPTSTSNATWLHARTLEYLEQLGLEQKFLSVGHPCHTCDLYIEGKLVTNISFEHLNSKYNYILTVPQHDTEKILLDYLTENDITVEYSSELIATNQQEHIITSSVKKSNGIIETINSKWLLACDGSNSFIREKLQIKFPGEDLTEQFMVADAIINTYMGKNKLHIFLTKGAFFIASPLNDNKYRIMANIHQEAPRQTFYKKEVIDIIQERGEGAYDVTDVTWISPFWIHGRISKTMRQGSIFLLGDAAHIHSPLGGQGMNLGMQDACNLAWKLALVTKGLAQESLLDSYEKERLSVAKRIVAHTDEITQMAIYNQNFSKQIKKLIQHKKQSNTKINKIISELSQINIQYKPSTIVQFDKSKNGSNLKAGTRMPDIKINNKKSLYSLLNNKFFHLMLFCDNAKTINNIVTALDKKYKKILKIHVITRSNFSSKKVHLIRNLNERNIFKNNSAVLIRPDLVIGLSTSVNIQKINKYFAFLTDK